MTIFTTIQREPETSSTAKSKDSLIITAAIEGIKESTIKCQVGSISVRLLD